MTTTTHHRLLLTGVFFLLLTALVIVLLSFGALAASNIHGTVTDAETDDPIVEADVYIYETGNKDNNYKTRTDRGGNYEQELDPGNYQISIKKDGYEEHTGEEDVGIEEQVEHNAELVPGEETYLEGVVTNADTGDPVSGAEVTLTAEKKDETLTGTTDRRGHYNISCTEGNYDIEIKHREYETHTGRANVKTGANRYDASLTPTSGDGGDDGGEDGGGDDDEGFQLAGSGGVMVSGWLVAIVLAIVLVLQMKNPGEGGKTAAQKQGASKSLSPEKTGNRCPKCGGKGQYNEKYQDQYCWECKDYFEDLK